MADLPAKNELWITRFFNGIVRSFRKEEKPVKVNHGATWENPYGVEAGGTYSPEQALSAYGGHGYTNAAVTRASQDLAALPLRLLKGKGKKAEIIEEHPFLDLMEQPSTTIDGFLFREQLRTDLMLSGNCYVLLLGLSDTPESIVRLHPDEVEIVTSPKLGITGYKHTSAGNSVIYPPERVIHGRNASFAKGPAGLYGTGAVQPLHREITSDINSQKLASQGSAKGRPDVLLSPQDPADVWGLERRRQILDQYNGMARSGGALVLSGMVKIDPLQLTPREMEYEKARIFARQSISAVTGVPPVILGLPSANYATARQQSITYWTNQSKAAIRMNHIYTKIAQLFDPDLRVEHDLSGVEALQAVRDAQLARINQHIMNGMPIADAYAYEGLADAPVVGSADDVEEADETEQTQSLALFLTKAARTDFPAAGDDKEVSLSNSQYKVFDVDFAFMIKEGYPSIWKKGGNIEGNNQFKRLYPIAQRSDKEPKTPTEDKAIRKREAWSARHFDDFRIAGVIAQVKWLTVGSRGEAYMKDLIREEMAKVDEKKSLDPGYAKLKALVPTEDEKKKRSGLAG